MKLVTTADISEYPEGNVKVEYTWVGDSDRAEDAGDSENVGEVA